MLVQYQSRLTSQQIHTVFKCFAIRVDFWYCVVIQNLSVLLQIAHLYPTQAPAVELKNELGAASALLPVSEVSL